MFKIIEGLAKAAIGVAVVVPASVIADVITMGGVMTERNKTYTEEAISDAMDNLKEATKPEEK